MGKGGPQPGSGRPRLYSDVLKRVTVTLPAEYVEWAKSRSLRGNVSDGLRRLLDDLDQLQGASRPVE